MEFYDSDKKYIDLFLQMLDCYEFELHYAGDVFYLNDLQNGNLGNIENETFETLKDVCDRMECYHNDYLYESVENDSELSVWDLACIYLVENSDFLGNIDVTNFKKYLKDKELDEEKFEEDYKIEYVDNYCSNHSYSYWYGGRVADIYSKYGKFEIDAIGDVYCTLFAKKDFKVNKEEFKKDDEIASVRDKNECGRFYNEFMDYITGDAHLSRILNDEDENMYLDIQNNNWLMISYIDKEGNIETIDDYESLDIDDAVDYVEEIIDYKNKHPKFKIFEEEIPVVKDEEAMEYC